MGNKMKQFVMHFTHNMWYVVAIIAIANQIDDDGSTEYHETNNYETVKYE